MRQGATRAAGVCHAYAAGRQDRAAVDTCNEEGLVPHIFGLKINRPIIIIVDRVFLSLYKKQILNSSYFS